MDEKLNLIYKKQSTAIDILKLLFAYGVVAIHTQAAKKFPLYLQLWTAMAVPFFFICSGFFFQEKLNKSSPETYRGGVKNYFKRLFRPFIIWGLWYLMLDGLNRVLIDGDGLQMVLYQLGQRLLVSSPGGGLWYIQAILSMLIILYIMNNRRHGMEAFTLILVTFYVFNTIISKCSTENEFMYYVKGHLFPKEYSALNFVFNGAFFLVGMVWSKYKDCKVATIILEYRWIILGSTIFLWFVQSEFTPINTVLWAFGNILRITTLFLCAMNLQIGIAPKVGAKMRSMSSRIYFLHFTVIYLMKICMRIIGIQYDGMILFILSAMVLSIVSYILDSQKLKWTKALF